ncbi:Phage tail assembly chaperone protein, E, or 41 or 14 [Cohnella sp. OV330]|uniref:phage tail assembly protein n=1 Tax=Cohnella sp. OV330 TaxID=1855288 RepID=UPI0008E101AC|nr:phage tail assembly protein [Cohnella sp. OV330]SFA91536.1 Phage tail assembly chaperone protein, E, or 41 or 14 [Cohnella sp. OV330]
MSEQPNTPAVQADEDLFVLSRPFVFEDKKITELRIDFDKLTGDDLIIAERRFLSELAPTEKPWGKEFSKSYLAFIVAAAASVPVELIRKLPAKDFTSVTLSAQNFLLL